MPEGATRHNVCWCVADTSLGKLTESYVVPDTRETRHLPQGTVWNWLESQGYEEVYVIPDVWSADRRIICMNLSEDHVFEWRMVFH